MEVVRSQWPLRPVSLRRSCISFNFQRNVSMASAAGVAATPCRLHQRGFFSVSQWPLRPVSLRQGAACDALSAVTSQWPLRPMSLRRRNWDIGHTYPHLSQWALRPVSLRPHHEMSRVAFCVSMAPAAGVAATVIIIFLILYVLSQWPLRPVSLRPHTCVEFTQWARINGLCGPNRCDQSHQSEAVPRNVPTHFQRTPAAS